jgi:hypothetical protein
MCTVTYISPSNGHFILTSNRDEQANRSAKQLVTQEQYGHQLMFPQDSAAGGTWIAASNSQRVVCLLNGAFEAHRPEPPYRLSRGIMVLESFGYHKPLDFFQQYDFFGIEPFTLIMADVMELWELRWDGSHLFFKELNPREPHIWSSSTLYPEPIRQKRLEWFSGWWKQGRRYELEEVLAFHRTAGTGDHRNDVVMNREGVVQTVSISSIEKMPKEVYLRHFDLITAASFAAKMEIKSELVESN